MKSGIPVPCATGLLLAVLHALDEPGHAQHVLRHALAPLAAGLAAGERLPQAVRGARELGDPGPLGRERAGQLLDLGAATGLELPHERGHPVELAAHVAELTLDEVALGGQRFAGAGALTLDEGAVRLDEVPEGGLLLLGRALGDAVRDVLRVGTGGRVGRLARHDERAGAGGRADGEGDEQGDEQDADHAADPRTGV